MTIYTRDYKQDATHWSLSGSSGAFAEPTWLPPVVIKVRWEERTELFTNANGEEEIARNIVYLGVDIKPGDRLLLGVSVAATPPAETSKLVKDFRKIPEVNGRLFERRALL